MFSFVVGGGGGGGFAYVASPFGGNEVLFVIRNTGHVPGSQICRN